MELKELVEKLDEMQKSKNDGRGVSCVRNIVTYLHCGYVESAKQTARIESDKIRNYPDIYEFIDNNLEHIPK